MKNEELLKLAKSITIEELLSVVTDYINEYKLQDLIQRYIQMKAGEKWLNDNYTNCPDCGCFMKRKRDGVCLSFKCSPRENHD